MDLCFLLTPKKKLIQLEQLDFEWFSFDRIINTRILRAIKLVQKNQD